MVVRPLLQRRLLERPNIALESNKHHQQQQKMDHIHARINPLVVCRNLHVDALIYNSVMLGSSDGTKLSDCTYGGSHTIEAGDIKK